MHVARVARAMAPGPFLNRITFSKSAILHSFPNFPTFFGFFPFKSTYDSYEPWKVSVRTFLRNPEHRHTDGQTRQLCIYRGQHFNGYRASRYGISRTIIVTVVLSMQWHKKTAGERTHIICTNCTRMSRCLMIWCSAVYAAVLSLSVCLSLSY